jgi:hypothetical protein
MSRFENFLEACDGSGKMDGTGKKKRKRKGKMDDNMNEAKSPKDEAMHWITQIEKSNGYREDDTSEWLGPMLHNVKKALKKMK